MEHAGVADENRQMSGNAVRYSSIIACAVAVFLVGDAQPSSAQQQSNAQHVGWLGLFNTSLLEWLENENRIESLCSRFAAGSEESYRCRDEQLAPKLHVVRLWAGPSETTRSAGLLLIQATPGKGLRSYYVDARGGPAREFRPDLYQSDWGYGPYFHETFVERRGSWFRLPEGPFPSGSWIKATDIGEEPQLRLLKDEEIVVSPFGDLRILGVERAVLRARLEQPADMWCREGQPPPLRPWKEMRIALRDLYTPTGHLRLQTKYTKGC